MKASLVKGLFCSACVALVAGFAQAQTKLKWAHVYETSEPYHRWSVWAAEEFKAHQRQVRDPGLPRRRAWAKESDINQGLQLGTVDIILTGASFAARARIRAWR